MEGNRCRDKGMTYVNKAIGGYNYYMTKLGCIPYETIMMCEVFFM